MSVTKPAISVTPRMGMLLTQLARTPDIENALWTVLREFLDLKIQSLEQQRQEYEAKWQMSFVEFSEQFAKGALPSDSYTYDLEQEFWAWEKVETLLTYYEDLKAK